MLDCSHEYFSVRSAHSHLPERFRKFLRGAKDVFEENGRGHYHGAIEGNAVGMSPAMAAALNEGHCRETDEEYVKKICIATPEYPPEQWGGLARTVQRAVISREGHGASGPRGASCGESAAHRVT